MQVTIHAPQSVSTDTRAWAEEGACKPRHGHDPSWWFPQADWSHLHPYVKKAKSVCQECPVRKECLSYGMEHEPYGIWGGLTEQERERQRRSSGLPMLLFRKR